MTALKNKHEPQKKAKILIVEDEQIIALDLKNFLQKKGFLVISIEGSGEDAIALAEKNRPDLILMDIHLKGEIDGIEAAEIINSKASIPVIFLTAYADENLFIRAGSAGGSAYLIKPVNRNELLATLMMLLTKSELEKKLAEGEKLFRELAENIHEVFWVSSPDWKEILYISPAYESIWGRSCESVYKQPLSWLDSVIEEDRERVKRNLDETGNISNKRTDVYSVEFRINHPDGSVRWIFARAFPIFNENGDVHRMTGISEDISERKNILDALETAHQQLEVRVAQRTSEYISVNKQLRNEIEERNRAQKALQESEEKFRLFTVSSPVGVFLANANGQCSYVNERWCELSYISVHDALTEHWTSAVHSADREKVLSAWNNLIDNKEEISIEFRIEGKGQEDSIVHTRVVPLRHDSGVELGFLGTVTDITEKRRMEYRLNQSQKMEALGTLAGGIAHDFNNVLFPIIGYTELAIENLPKEIVKDYNLKDVLSAAVRAKDLVRQILTFSRRDSLDLEPLMIQTVVKEALKLIRASLSANIEIIQNMEEGCGMIMANPTYIHQIVMNLCTNSFHAMQEKGGKLKINLKEVFMTAKDISIGGLSLDPGKFVELTVSDTGHGMESALIPLVFDPYFTTKGKNKGTGLGLSVVHGIVKKMDGDIRVASKPGKGTEFRIYFPKIENRWDVPEQITTKSDPTGNEHILLVDDEVPVVNMMDQLLGYLGYKVTATKSSLEALKMFRDHPDVFDLVITDMAMPEMLGTELAIKFMDIRPGIPVILCTGFSDLITKEKAYAMGIKELVMKPPIKSELAKTIRNVIDLNKKH